MAYTGEEKRAYQRAWIEKRRQEGIRLLGSECVKCGSVEDLEFDHCDPEVKLSHRIWSWAAQRRFAELEKCQLLCRVCHLKKTISEKLTTQHGTCGMYENHKCRCTECKLWKKEKNAKRYLLP